MATQAPHDVIVKGVRVPALGFGTWPLSGRACRDAVRTALELGYRHIDTAQMYGNEAEVGAAIRDSGVARDALFVTTKLDLSSLTAEAVKRSTEQSLARLKLDHVDLLLIHWPSTEVPLGETLGAMAELRAKGLAHNIGVSNFTVALLREAVEVHRADLLCNQVEYHPFLSQRAVLPATRGHGLMLAAYCPLARGRVAEDATLAKIGRQYGKSAAQIALRWLVDQDGVAALPKAGSRAHAEANLAIFDFALSDADRAAIAALPKNQRVVNIGWAPQWDPA
jgi:2,5-diketo-D-gluconate reductase B